MADETKVDETTAQDNDQELDNFLGVDPIYMNYSDDRNRPFRAEEVDDEDDENAVQPNAEVVSTEEVAYSHQEWTREDAGQDPVTGEPIVKDAKEAFDEKRDLYKDPNWGPNVPHAMTGKSEESGPSDEQANAARTESNTPSSNTSNSTSTGSAEGVNADGTTSEAKAPSAPAAPKAAAKKTASSDNK